MMFDSAIYDLDGVLADETRSYREAIRLTAQRLAGKNVEKSDVNALKKVPGFNNDWDCAYRLAQLLGRKAKREEFAATARPLSQDERKSAEYGEATRLFQENYLRLRQNEKLLVKKSDLEKVAEAGLKQAIATGRPKPEAMWFLQKEGLEYIFPAKGVVGLEDARQKPDPAPLLLAKKRLGAQRPVYVGDTVNDALAARAAGMPCIIVGQKIDGTVFVETPEKMFEEILK